MFVNSVFHQLNNSISSAFLHFLILLIWHYLIRLIFLHPPLLLSTELFLSLPSLILSLLNQGNYFVDYNVTMNPLNLTLILLHLKFVDRFTRINFSLPNRYTSLICSVVMEYLLSKLTNYLSP